MAEPNLDAVATTTLKNYNKKFADNVSDNISLFKWLKKFGTVKVGGGEELVEELMYAEGNGGSYSGADPLTITVPEGISNAEYNWKQVYATVTLTGTDQLRNSGKEKIQSLMSARILQAEITASNKIGNQIFGDGTGNSGKDVLGLEAIMDQTPATGILGGIDGSTYTWWRNYVKLSAGAFPTTGAAEMGTAIRAMTRGMERPDLIVVNSTYYGYLQALAVGKSEMSNPKLADLGFQALKFEGIDIIYDSQCTADRMYFINSKYLKLKVHQDRNFKMGKFIEPADADQLVAKILWAGQVTCSNRSMQGVISGFTAS